MAWRLAVSEGLFKHGDVKDRVDARMLWKFKFVSNLPDSFFNLIWPIISASQLLVSSGKNRVLPIRVKSKIHLITSLELNIPTLLVNSLLVVIVSGG